MQKQFFTWFLSILMFIIGTPLFSQNIDSNELERLSQKITSELIDNKLISYNLGLSIDSASVDIDNKTLKLFFSEELTYLPIREEWLVEFKSIVRESQKRKIRNNYEILIYSSSKLVSTYIPNVFRNEIAIDTSRQETRKLSTKSHVENIDAKYVFSEGLQNRHIAVWGGHGFYYSIEDSLWQWQRPNLFTTVEDLLTYSYVVPYIIPMLENAGANVYYPKERDTQTQELVVDFDSNPSLVKLTEGIENIDGGFKLKETYTDLENPFSLGTHHEMKTNISSGRKDSIVYKINDAQSGMFAVYVSYHKTDSNVSDVEYDVYHDGGKTTFVVNQNMGYGTWVYLGSFQFGNNNHSKIVVNNNSKENGVITSDAIKVGGGFNRIERNGSVSIKPAYMNAGRYYLQYAGMPDSTVYTLSKGEDDYKDDYRSRGEWVNYLLGQPYSTNRDSSLQGLNIPIDLSLAFHTDATTTKTDSVIGTLSIHSTYGFKGERHFPDGRNRFASRDLADIVQTEIVSTIQNKYNPEWVRRAMWDKQYSEATYPNVPSMLIELLSHQNFGDMKYGLDPNFKFDVSRAIYKGVLKFISNSNNIDYVVQPLPVNSFAVNYKDEKLVLSWSKTIDREEETANPDAYIVYTKIGEGGYDNGVLVNTEEYVLDDFEIGKQYSFKVKAVNKGGVSFDSEILSACIFSKSDNPVLILNAFDKVSSPEFFETDSLGGFTDWKKSAISSGSNPSFIGQQYNFDKTQPWETNPLTGHGASYSENVNTPIIGNTFDYPYIHGHKFKKHKISYVSSSIKDFEKNTSLYLSYSKIDLIFGKQSTYNSPASTKDYSVFREKTRNAISTWLSEDKSLLISGAFVASDVFLENSKDTARTTWVKNKLNYDVVTDKASVSGNLIGVNNIFKINKKAIGQNYELRSVDALKNVGNGSVMFRYKDNSYSAGVYSEVDGYKVITIGFPLENVIENQEEIFDEVIMKLGW